jgi:hypothetical protein
VYHSALGWGIDMPNEGHLKSLGFQGFVTVRELWNNRQLLPVSGGVYALLYPYPDRPEFLVTGSGGHFKGKNPNASVAELDARWVNGPVVIYYGKADAASSGRGIRKRMGEFLEFGAGKAVGHWGGRYTWQIPNAGGLVCCWKETPDKTPRDVERSLIAEFATHFGQRPFANISG